MQLWQRNSYLLWLAVFITSACWSMVMPFMPVFLAQELGVTSGVATWAGALGAVNAAGMMIMSPIWGALGDRVGRKAMMLRAGGFLSLAYALMSLVQGPWQLLGVRVMIGMLTGFIPTATALVGTTTPQEYVGRTLAMVATASPTGTILGPMLGGLLADLFGMRMTMASGAVLTGTATLLVLVGVKEQFTPQRGEGFHPVRDLTDVLRLPSFGAIIMITLLFNAAVTLLDPMLVPFIASILGKGSANWLAGLLYALPGIAFLLASGRWARVGEGWGYRLTVTAGMALAALFSLSQTMAGNGWVFGGMRFGAGLMLAAVTPGVFALIAQVVPLELRGRAYGINTSANSLGGAVGPLLGGAVATGLGPRPVFVVAALLLAAGAVWTWRQVAPHSAESALWAWRNWRRASRHSG
ncbi:MAG: MFS transporter [Mycobacterium leprae]